MNIFDKLFSGAVVIGIAFPIFSVGFVEFFLALFKDVVCLGN